MLRPLIFALLVPVLSVSTEGVEPVVLTQVVSRHDPHFDVARSRMSIGRDGYVYLVNGGGNGGYVLRVSPDGRDRFGGTVGYSAQSVAADRNGTVATAEAHFAHRAAFWGKRFAALGHVPDFLVSDQVQWNAPSDICAGASGDFYAVDQHRLRVLRVTAPDKLAEAYSLEPTGEQSKGGAVGLRVDEQRKRFLTAWPDSTIWATGFDGKPLWSLKARPAGETPGGFDLDEAGRLYLITGGSDVVTTFDADGNKVGEIKLLPDRAGKPAPIHDLRFLGTQFVVKRSDPAALFEVYDATSGALVRRVPADVETLTVRYESPVWTAGQPVPFEINFDPNTRATQPVFRVWYRPLGVPEFTELPRQGRTLTPPGDMRGLYQIRVTPDIHGRVAESIVDGFVEVRSPESIGSVSLFTPLNRFYYGTGEDIPVTVVLRAAPGVTPVDALTVRLMHDTTVVQEATLKLTDGKADWTIGAAETRLLKPGRYLLDAALPRTAGGRTFTIAPQHLEIGPGLQTRPRFHIVQHGDYSLGFPAGPRPVGLNLPQLVDLPDTAADHLVRARRLGLNLFVDRLGLPSMGLSSLTDIARDAALVERLTADPIAVAPDKAALEGAVRRTVAGYGAYGIEEQAILLYMDAGLPLGTLYDSRKPEQMEQNLQLASRQLQPYPAFRGWSWAANWWLEKHGAAAAIDASERATFETAFKAARETGAWSPVLDTVSERTFAHAIAAERRLRSVLDATVPGKISAMTGPYRAIQTHPPLIFANADEVDLHYQAEQIQPPQVTPHHVDFYKRPGKAAWGHPELWNDDGTGGMIFPSLFQMAMRGADGVGQSGPVGPWGGPDPGRSDPRSGAAGTTSAFRAIYALLQQYGDWLTTLQNADRVAIVVSTRMQRLETWDGKIGGAYFDSLFEAYNACLYAHRPASFVFSEDLQPDTFKRFQAVLVVNQRVPFEPPLAAALQQAQAGGVHLFHDGTCRPELMQGFAPLGVSFDRVRQDPSAWQDDAAYDRFPRYFKEHAATIRETLGTVVRPVAECANPEVMLTERRSDKGRFIWAVNNTMPGFDPGVAWRMTLLISQRVPVVETLKLDVPEGWSVYDVFDRKPVPHAGGVISCDLRTMPARLFALLPPASGGAVPPGIDAGHRDVPVERGEQLFGPHVRDIAISHDGQSALLNCFNWDHNLYGIDLATGATRWRNKVGHAYAFDPGSTADGFTVQGFDAASAAGYHLFFLQPDGKPERRYALFGLPKRATGWASAAQIQDAGINSFAVPPDAGWVASAGDLGLVVWDRQGKQLWSDEWWPTARNRVRLLAVDHDTLAVFDGATATARNARTGKVVWKHQLSDSGTIRGGVMSGDRRTLVIHADSLGGRLFVIRDAKLLNTIPTPADEVAVAADGSLIAATSGRLLKMIDPLGGLLWTFTGDDVLRHPRFSITGRRLAIGSELGTLSILEPDGTLQAERDLAALPVAAWLPDGDLVAATWMGKVVRSGPDLRPRWETALIPTETDIRPRLLARDATPTVQTTSWGNAAPSPLPLSPNLLTETKAMISAVHVPRSHGDPLPWKHKVDLLTDGQAEPPAAPWLEWTEIGFIDSGWKSKLAIEIDTFRTQMRVTGITVAEDAAHPESWLRDIRVQWWDAAKEQWHDGPWLLSNSALHSHLFEQPIEAARIRLVSTGGGTWPIGNLRLGELVFHGEILGCSHPDALAKQPVVVLFDENESDAACLKYPGRPFAFRYGGAFSGGKCLELSASGQTGPAWQPPFGHAIPNWDFEIAEQPRPGQYRYLQFAWKAASPETTGIGLLLGRAWPGGGVAVLSGDAKWNEGVIVSQPVEGQPPTDWATVRVDLWAITKGKPPRIQALSLTSTGGGAAFDQILLGRTEQDLDRVKPLK